MAEKGSRLSNLLRTTDHKTIGLMYMATSFAFFIAGGLMALLMRGELARPELQFLSPEQYNQLLTMHGTIMLLMFATPLFFAFGNLIMPLQIGSPDVAFPRLNALSYWLFLFGSLIAVSGFLTPGGAADFGWYAYAPLSDVVHSPGAGANMWFAGLAVSGLVDEVRRGAERMHGRADVVCEPGLGQRPRAHAAARRVLGLHDERAQTGARERDRSRQAVRPRTDDHDVVTSRTAGG